VTEVLGKKSGRSGLAKAHRAKRPRLALLVLGMHRSGTSALSGLLAALGCDAPATPMTADAANPKGHFESEPLFALHEEMLASAGSAWHDYRQFPKTWLRSPKADEFRERFQETLLAEFGRSAFFVIKDPRICRFLPFWIDVLAEMDVAPLIVHTHRNPLEVAASLHKRDGFDPAYGQLLWLRHVLDAEQASRDLPRVFTSYPQLLSNWAGAVERIAEGLTVSWPRFSPINADELNAFISPELHHQVIPPEKVLQNKLLSDWIRDSFAIFESWADTGEDIQDRQRLDAIREGFDASTTAFGSLVRRNGGASVAERDAARARLKVTEEAFGERSQRLETLTSELQAAREQIAEHGKTSQALVAERDASRARLDEVSAALDERDEAVLELAAARDRLQSELDEARSTLAQRRAEIDDAHRERDAAVAARSETEAQRLALEARLATLDTETMSLRAGIVRRDAELARFTTLVVASQRQAETAQARLDAELSEMIARAEAASQRQSEAAQARLDAELSKVTARAAAGSQRQAEAAQARLDAELSKVTARAAAASQHQAETAKARLDAELGEVTARAAAASQLQAETAQARLDAELGKIMARAEAAEAYTRALLSSTSWRFTAPIRRLVELIRGQHRPTK